MKNYSVATIFLSLMNCYSPAYAANDGEIKGPNMERGAVFLQIARMKFAKNVYGSQRALAYTPSFIGLDMPESHREKYKKRKPSPITVSLVKSSRLRRRKSPQTVNSSNSFDALTQNNRGIKRKLSEMLESDENKENFDPNLGTNNLLDSKTASSVPDERKIKRRRIEISKKRILTIKTLPGEVSDKHPD